MANVLNRTTLEYLTSVNTPDYSDPPWLIDPDLSGVVGVEQKYWNLTGDVVSEMTQPEKDAVDAAEAAALITANRADAITSMQTQIDAIGWLVRELLERITEERNYNTRRLMQTQNVLAAMMTEAGGASSMKAAAITEAAVHTGNLGPITQSAAAALHFASMTKQIRSVVMTEFEADMNAGTADT